jgi:hypothetical protein
MNTIVLVALANVNNKPIRANNETFKLFWVRFSENPQISIIVCKLCGKNIFRRIHMTLITLIRSCCCILQ